jgi:hypothetical protein
MKSRHKAMARRCVATRTIVPEPIVELDSVRILLADTLVFAHLGTISVLRMGAKLVFP